MRKGQITVIFIVGLLLVIGVALYLYTQRAPILTLTTGEFGNAQQAVQQCFVASVHKSLVYVASTGGYVITPQKTIDYNGSFVAIERDSSGSLVPSLDVIANQTALAIRGMLMPCLRDAKLTDMGFTVQEPSELPAITITFGEKTTARLHWPIRISRMNRTYTFTDTIALDDFQMKALHDDAERIAATTTDDALDLKTMNSLGSKTTYVTHDTSTLLFTLDRNQNVFAFAAEIHPTQPPYAPSPGTVTMTLGERRTLSLGASDPQGLALTYSTDSWLYEIGDDGTLTITATERGTFDTTVTITNSKGLSWKVPITITIT